MKQLEQIYSEIDTQTNDRALALVGGGFVDDCLGIMLGMKLEVATKRALSDEETIELFENFGPLYTFDLRIKMAAVLGIIDADLRKNIEGIKTIRNYFAHETAPIFFHDHDVAIAIDKLTLWKNAIGQKDQEISTPKGKFKMSVRLGISFIMASIADDIETYAEIHGLRAHASPEKSK